MKKFLLWRIVAPFLGAVFFGFLIFTWIGADASIPKNQKTGAVQVGSGLAPRQSLRPQARVMVHSRAPRHSLRPRARFIASSYGTWRKIAPISWIKDVGLHTCWVSKNQAGVWTFGEDVSKSPLIVERNQYGTFRKGTIEDLSVLNVFCGEPLIPARLRPVWWM